MPFTLGENRSSFMRYMLIRIASIFLIFCSVSAWASYAYSAEKLRVGWVYAMGNTPLLIAKYNGYFKQAGVDVELVEFDSGPLIKRALEAGDLDLAYMGMPAMAHSVADGINLKIVAKVSYGNAALITKKDSPIRQLSDLKNKKIAGVRKRSGMDVMLRGYVLGERAKLDADKDVTILHMPTKMMDASVHQGVVDAAFAWEPYVSLAVLTKHARVLLDTNTAIPKHPWYVIAARESTLENKRKELYKVLEAHKRAVVYLRTDPSAGMALIIKTFNLENAVSYSNKKILPKEVVTEARKRLGWECQFRQTDRNFLERLIDYSHELGYLKRKLQADDLIDDEAITYIKELGQ